MINTPEQVLGTVAAIFIDMKPGFFNGLLISLILALAFILILTWRKGWRDFSIDHKWSSRVILLVLSLFIAVPALFLPAKAVSNVLFGKIAMESPNLTATAIKLGLYGLYRNYEISAQLAPERRDLVGCVAAISSIEAQDFQKKCGDDQACFTNIPIMIMSTLISRIQKAMTNSSSEANSACKTVDVSKIN
jgi:hypothetical protein